MEDLLVTEELLEFLYDQFGEPDLSSLSTELKNAWLCVIERRKNP